MDVNSVMRKTKIHITEVRKPEKREWTEALSLESACGLCKLCTMAKNFPELMKEISCEI